METFKIKGVEIFSTGVWNNDEYTIEDLHGMVRGFDDNKIGYRPFLKLGHDPDQKLLQKDGYPAAGWVDRIYVVGDKLVADFCDIPKKIFDLIKIKAYRKVSCEIYWNLKVGEKLYTKLLGAVALLGADNPGVMNLNDILGQYAKTFSSETPKSYNGIDLKLKGGLLMEKTEKEIKLELDLAAKAQELEQKEATLKKYSQDQADLSKEIADLKEYKLASEKKEKELAEKLEQERQEKFLSDLQNEKLISPAMKPYVKELLGVEKKEYSIQDKKMSKQDVLKECLKLFKAASELNFEEKTEGEKKDYKKDVLSKEQEKQVQEYMKDNKCTYGKAVKELGLNKKGE